MQHSSIGITDSDLDDRYIFGILDCQRLNPDGQTEIIADDEIYNGPPFPFDKVEQAVREDLNGDNELESVIVEQRKRSIHFGALCKEGGDPEAVSAKVRERISSMHLQGFNLTLSCFMYPKKQVINSP